jgi:3-hydroxybutyryl-CoA dehydrogenase
VDLKTIAVIGAGPLGRQIAGLLVSGGYRTVLEDASISRLGEAIAWIKSRSAAIPNLATATSVEDAIRDADLIIETVPDEIEMKIELFTIFDKFAKPGAIFASTAASLSVAELASMTFCPERCVGMRFPELEREADPIEFVKSPTTSEETIARCCEVFRQVGREVVVSTEIVFRADPAERADA